MKNIFLLIIFFPVLAPAQIGRVNSMAAPNVAGATISLSRSSFGPFITSTGSASPDSTFTAVGSLLTIAGTVTAPTGYEISLDGVAYFGTLTLPLTSGAFTGQPVTIHIRLAAADAVGPYSGNCSVASSPGATTKTVGVTGTVTGIKDSIYIQLDTTSTTQTGWVSLRGDPHLRVLTATNASGLLTVSSVSTSNWLPFFSVCAAANNGNNTATAIAPANAMNEFWFCNNFPTSFTDAYDVAKPKLQITGAKTSASYTVTISAAAPSGSVLSNTDYRVIGASDYGIQTVNTNGNISVVATYTNVVPDGTGKIKIYSNAHDANQELSEIGIVKVKEN